ncbi:MAG: hypothetical protein HN952_08155, partial [Candidatus Cloacimonetes bacterium]|nr:hypothetical protein [Candidatus Cloacimonadota bacterium]
IEQHLKNQLLESQQESFKKISIKLLLDEIQQTKICICGRSTDTEHLNSIHAKINLSEELAEKPDQLAGVEFLLTQLKKNKKLIHEKPVYAELVAKLATVENDLDELITSQKAKELKLGGISDEIIVSLNKALDETEKEIKRKASESGGLVRDIEILTSEKNDLEKKIKTIEGRVSDLDLLNTQINLLENTSDAFKEIVKRATLAKQSEIEEASTEYFKQITNKDSGYERIVINDNFSFGIETVKKTRPPMPLISAGEKQVTALSFILGLNKYTQRQAPILMDTPMGRLDKTHRRNVSKVLFELALSGRQIILLVTDTDIAFGVYDILQPNICAEFEIVYDQDNLTSTLKRI